MIQPKKDAAFQSSFDKHRNQWYSQLREGEYEYLHEFKQRIDEIIDMQRQHHEIITTNQNRPGVVQTSLAELHKLNITLSNYYDIAQYIIPKLGADVSSNGNSIPVKAQGKDSDNIIV